MADAAVHTVVNATPDELWALVGNFGGVAGYLPGIDSCELVGDDRVLTMMGMRITERLVDRDDATRSLTYAIVDGVPVESHEATITVAPAGDRSLVTWAVSATPDEMLPVFTDTYQKGLDALAARFA